MPPDAQQNAATNMPDDAAVAGQQIQQQPQGGLTGGTGLTGGGGGIFHSLVSTLLRGAMGGAQQTLSQMGQAPNATPAQRALSGGYNAQEIAQQKNVQKQAQMDEQTSRQQRIALSQVQYLQAKHLLAKSDEATQAAGYNTAATWADKLDEGGMMEWLGGTSENQQDLIQEVSKQKSLHPGMDIRIFPKGGTTYDHPLFQVGMVRNGNMPTEIKLTGLPGVKGMPPMPISANAGGDATDTQGQVTYDLLTGLVHNHQMETAKPFDDPPPQVTPEEFKQSWEQGGYPPIANFSNVWAYLNGKDDGSSLPSKGSRNRMGWTMSKDDAEDMARSSGVFPDFDPKEVANDAAIRKEVTTKLDSMDSWAKADDAVNAIQRAYKTAKTPATKQLLDSGYNQAVARRSQFPTPKEAAENKDDTKNERFVQGEIDKARIPIQHVIEQDHGKVQDLGAAIDQLNQGGGEYDAVAKIQALRGTVGGGGVRITGAELNSLGSQARSWAGDFDVWLSKASRDPNKSVNLLTAGQRTQLKSILADAYNLIAKKDNAYMDAEDKILHAQSVGQIRDAESEMNKSLRIRPIPSGTVIGPALQADGKTPYPDGHTGHTKDGKPTIVRNGQWTITGQ